ncbi:prefoldin subunit 5 [Schizosaccharomyces cryophilus OY26]|uniref:Prefoldin subunit 5 n=1 Tax=Schizosaccharomyces cryophilus (strain OY26 / ATCC MYA-4695 / CBS 11777 / NBRC 106824 / NRRL Y48691) TaxID=653667 RepID=S9XIT2_SCHCR|nr:prefoldin subunit 5 [Schizosaccharomyces cryophilus OY26]EPY53546.1 prefoldin subunit 5 [Schizosaccharomyces cryophilus OY26]
MAEGSKSINLASLSLEQLAEVIKQLNTELEYLSSSYAQLGRAHVKFLGCLHSIKETVKAENEERDMLVPLTTSLYVPGKLKLGNRKVLIDIGTGYFVEKRAPDAIEYYQRKCEYLKNSIESISSAVEAKSSQIRAVQSVMQQKATEQSTKNASAST